MEFAFSAWAVSLGLIPSRPVHVVASGKISSFHDWVVSQWMYVLHVFFIPVDEHLGCFHILDILNNAVMNTGGHISLWIGVFIFFRSLSRCATAGLWAVVSFLIFEDSPCCFLQWLYQFTFPAGVRVSFPTTSATFAICCLFDRHSDRCEDVSFCGFDLPFPENY